MSTKKQTKQSKVSQERNKKYGNSGKNKHTGNRTPNERENNRGDIIKEHQKEQSNLQNDGRWYYGDVVLGDEISRFSFNQFGGMTTKPFVSAGGINMPTIMSLPLNPCLGVTDSYDSITEADMVYRLQTNGINQALQQWWSVLTSKAGRGAQYTKQDLGILIGAIGELISISEFLRRPFAYKFLYSERTRILPKQLLYAMGVDADDFLANIANYRLQLNSLITRLNQIPIPGNINYFAKCQNLYQKVYADAGSPLSQLYVTVPYTTWIIDEQLSTTGSVLKTIDGVATVNRTTPNWHTNVVAPRPFSAWLREFEQMISALLSSTTWSAIYSDLLNASTFNTVSLWHFDLVTEDYKLEVMYDPSFLLQVHNMMFTPPLVCDGTYIANEIETGTDYYSRFYHGTPLNDVYCDPDLDILVQNPTFGYDTSYMVYDPHPIVVDMLTPTPTPEERIEANVFKIGYSGKTGPDANVGPAYQSIINMVLPDHYALTPIIWRASSQQKYCCPIVLYGDYQYEPTVLAASSRADWAFYWSKFQWAPIWFSAKNGTELANPIGELNYFTLLDQDWVIRTTDAKYLGLFEIL